MKIYSNFSIATKDILSQFEELKKQGNTLENQQQTVESVCSKQLDTGVCTALLNGNFEKFKTGTFNNDDLLTFVATQIAKERKNSGSSHGHHH